MNAVERQERAVLRRAKEFCRSGSGEHGENGFRLYQAVKELEATEELARARRRKALKHYPMIDCRVCGRRHRNNIDHQRRRW